MKSWLYNQWFIIPHVEDQCSFGRLWRWKITQGNYFWRLCIENLQNAICSLKNTEHGKLPTFLSVRCVNVLQDVDLQNGALFAVETCAILIIYSGISLWVSWSANFNPSPTGFFFLKSSRITGWWYQPWNSVKFWSFPHTLGYNCFLQKSL